MPSPSAHLSATLGTVVDAVKKTLRDLEPREVPVALRRVAASSAQRMPPPLLRSIFIELDRNDWFRDKVAETLGDEESLAAQYLAAEPGWWLKLVDEVAASAVSEAEGDADRTGEIAQLEARLVEAKRRNSELRDERDRLATESRAVRRELKDWSQSLGDGAGRTNDLEDRVERLQQQVDEERQARSDAETRLGELRRRTERRRAVAAARDEPAPVRTVGMEDPVAAARRLDVDIAALAASVPARQPAQVAEDPHIPTPTRLTVPVGVPPDAAEAVDWLVGVTEVATVVIDGYNVTYLIDAAQFATGEMRRQLVAGVRRMQRQSQAKHRFVVVFDSHEAGDGEASKMDGGIEVRFSASHRIADDEIVELAGALDGPVVVFSNDRELRERSDAVGATTLWGAALVDWLG